MPLYEYECDDCGVFEHVARVAESNLPRLCPECGKIGKKILSPTQISVDNTEYDCPITGKMITSRRKHRENLKIHGCREYENGEKEEGQRKRLLEDKALDAKIEQTVGEFIHGLPAHKVEQLGCELEHGVDATVVRQ